MVRNVCLFRSNSLHLRHRNVINGQNKHSKDFPWDISFKQLISICKLKKDTFYSYISIVRAKYLNDIYILQRR